MDIGHIHLILRLLDPLLESPVSFGLPAVIRLEMRRKGLNRPDLGRRGKVLLASKLEVGEILSIQVSKLKGNGLFSKGDNLTLTFPI